MTCSPVAFGLWLVTALPAVASAENGGGDGTAAEAYWRELEEASDGLLRSRAAEAGIAMNRVEYPLVAEEGGWEPGAPIKERTRFLADEIRESGLPAKTAVEYRGYIHLAEERILGVKVAAYGRVRVTVNAEPLASLEALDATGSRTEYLELGGGYHPVRVTLANPFPGGSLAVSFDRAEGATVRFAVDLAAASGESPAKELPESVPPLLETKAGRLAAVTEWLRTMVTGRPGTDLGRPSGGLREGVGALPEANPYLLILESSGGHLWEFPNMSRCLPEPLTSAETIVRASGEEGFLFLLASRWPGPPAVLPSVLLRVETALAEPVHLPQASQLRVEGNRPRVLPIGIETGGFRLFHSTAQPIALFQNGGTSYLVSAGEAGEMVEYAFPTGAAVDLPPWMRLFDVKDYGRIVVASPSDRGQFSVGVAGGAGLVVKTITFQEAERARIWGSEDPQVLVLSELAPVGEAEDGTRVRMPVGGHASVRLFPGDRVQGIECDGRVFEAHRQDDWALVQLSPPMPLVAARIVGRSRIEFPAVKMAPGVKNIDLTVRFEGSAARAYAGDNLVAETHSPDRPWDFSILDVIEAGQRSLRLEFDPPEGRLLSVHVEALVEKVATVRFRTPESR